MLNCSPPYHSDVECVVETSTGLHVFLCHGNNRAEVVENAKALTEILNSHNELIETCERLYKLASLVTVSQAIHGDCADVAGLNEWCMNEGMAIGDESLDLWWARDAINQAKGE